MHSCPGAASLAVIALAGCASTNPAAIPKEPVYSDCLFTRTVDDWSPLDKQHLIIFGPLRRDAYLARLFFPTPDLMTDVGIVIFDDNGSGSICGGGTDALVFGPRSAVPGKNSIVSMQKIDPARADELLSLAKAGDKDALQRELTATARQSMTEPAPAPAN
jgi:hypothetical protein